jgi:hypothetical protein
MFASGNRRVASAIVAALAALAIAVLIATLITGGARADGSFASTGDDLGLTVPGDHSAGDQYVETLPTIGGPRAPRKSKRAKKLPKHVTKKLEQFGGADTGTLAQLADSTALGARGEGKRSKDASANGKGSQQGRARKHKRDGGSGPAVPSAAINAADRGEAGLGWLAIAILAITALSLGAVVYQRHRHKDSTGR